MNFDTLTVPPPCTDHSLMHNAIRSRSRGQKGLQVRFYEKRLFRAIFVGSTRFLSLESICLEHPRCGQTPCRRHLARFSLIFGPYGARFGPFSARLGAFATDNYLPKWKTQWWISTVPPPFTDHSLMHNTTRRRSLGQKGLQVRFREKRPFWAIFVGYSTRFLALGSIYVQHPRCG
jgi:hypothetical protein